MTNDKNADTSEQQAHLERFFAREGRENVAILTGAVMRVIMRNVGHDRIEDEDLDMLTAVQLYGEKLALRAREIGQANLDVGTGLDKLADFIHDNFPGEPREGDAAEAAVRLLAGFVATEERAHIPDLVDPVEEGPAGTEPEAPADAEADAHASEALAVIGDDPDAEEPREGSTLRPRRDPLRGLTPPADE